jgi:hypothetical protein
VWDVRADAGAGVGSSESMDMSDFLSLFMQRSRYMCV